MLTFYYLLIEFKYKSRVWETEVAVIKRELRFLSNDTETASCIVQFRKLVLGINIESQHAYFYIDELVKFNFFYY